MTELQPDMSEAPGITFFLINGTGHYDTPLNATVKKKGPIDDTRDPACARIVNERRNRDGHALREPIKMIKS